ncbi:MAG: glycoside hydrolase family 2 TIM barrel-domain containing protein [Capsulimonadaceae bacterium]
METRRDFLKKTALLAGATLAGLPVVAELAPPADAGADAVVDSPRRVELLDSDWRFQLVDAMFGVALTDWTWTPGTPGPIPPVTGAWKKTTSGEDTLAPNSYGWFRTVLPDLKGPGRTVHFDCVDDNGTVYLNGTELLHHEGWDDPFDVDLDPAWLLGGPNVLVVLVQNIGGPGGITRPVRAGRRLPDVDLAGIHHDDSGWRTVQVPHDYVVESPFDPHADTGHGALPLTPAWYRRRFTLPLSDRGKCVELYFEGVYRNATVYVNGRKVYFQDDGYDPFHVDIGSAVMFGAENVLAVHVDPCRAEGWWYEGGGIYRHVWLTVCDPLHVIPWGVYVTSRVTDLLALTRSAELTIVTELVNDGPHTRWFNLATTVLDPQGKPAVSAVSSHAALPGQQMKLIQTTSLNRAELWSLETPVLYTAVTTVTERRRVVDTFRQTFGIRMIRFDADHGFFLNEKPVKLQGTCNHQDAVGVGIGVPDSLLWWRIQRLKDTLGCNAIRCSHNPMAPALYDACDGLGMLVMDETRHPGTAPDVKAVVGTPFADTEHIEKMVRRDRNHPSVILWSMANEEWSVQGDPYGATMMKALMAAVHRHDTTRPVSSAVNSGTGNGWMVGFGSVEDLLGVNYNYQDYDWLHAQYPARPIFGSETASDISCRGNYETDPVRAHLASYMSPEGSWRPLAEREFVAGGFAWTGFDYRGETTPYGWPEVNSNYGLLDLCGFPKDAAFYYKAWWIPERPMVHIFPHWNWPGREGSAVPVWCFSNCERVELFLDGLSQGAQDMPRYGHVQWDHVVYAPGALVAVGYRAGRAVARKVVETTGPPRALRLSAVRNALAMDGRDTIPVEVEVVDAVGRVVPTAGNPVAFAVRGAGAIAGVGNGDPSSHELNQADTRSAFNGRCMVLVRSGTTRGTALLTADSDGLTGAMLTFHVA